MCYGIKHCADSERHVIIEFATMSEAQIGLANDDVECILKDKGVAVTYVEALNDGESYSDTLEVIEQNKT